MSQLRLKDRTHLRERYIDPALAGGWVEHIIPEKPTSRSQQYRLTALGQTALGELKSGGGK